MGTDIHLFVEYRLDRGGDYFSLTRGSFDLTRNYAAFAALAGVRAEDTEAKPRIAPRGFPPDASWHARAEYYRRISDEPGHHAGSFRLVTPEQARDDVARGLSHTKTFTRTARHEELVSDPDAHTPSWLTGEELASVLDVAPVRDELWADYRIVIAALEELATSDGRAVFWFTD
ncbi:MAG TPA: hypothetical protein VKZ18_17075 [Polyangia bacterium]|nr:hypothetical protein [Polyangia bacterium]